jgi:hypothetical protein
LLLTVINIDSTAIPHLIYSSDLLHGKIVIRPEEIKIRADLESAYASGVICKIDYYGHDAVLTIEVESKLI